ncbi:toxin CcdB [Rhizobium binae]|uniref:Toxin CcdB n=1 Tax=Rhizobium binae TaxID=1138190 RepID=A0ABV2MMM1_9HYPH|nr:CcdB family protein [Rhizobium binae]
MSKNTACRFRNIGSSDGSVSCLQCDPWDALALDLQSGLHGDLTTRIMAPMLPLEASQNHVSAQPAIRDQRRAIRYGDQFIGAISVKEIGVAADLAADGDRIITALNFQGL